jgi:hypothetical protein
MATLERTLNIRFAFKAVETLPRLAWCARITRGDPQIRVYHGIWVETQEGFFCEGAWDSDFVMAGFAQSPVFMGSGGKITKDGVMFSSPCHTLEKLYLIREKNGVICSNSLVFALSQANDWLKKDYEFYHADLSSIMRGLKKHTRWIPTQRFNRIYLYYFCNILVDLNLMCMVFPKNSPESFTTYKDYLYFLQDSIRGLYQNATAPSRKMIYQPLATISSGYDSPAAAVLAKEIGCTQAVTFIQARPGFITTEDSGKKIGELLGFHVAEYTRDAYVYGENFPEAEFLALGTAGEDVVMMPLESVLSAKLLFTGYHGDKVWDRNNSKVTPDIVRGDVSGTSLAEFRLRLGFIHLPVPFLGCVRHASIHAISNSNEMQPWSIGGRYDRPIPRRLVEENGIPRNLVGQQKKAISQPFTMQFVQGESLKTVMSAKSYQDFMNFAQAIPLFQRWGDRVFFTFMHVLYDINCQANRKLEAILRRFGRSLHLEPVVPGKFKDLPTVPVLTFHWGIDKIKSRYFIAISEK